jgi:hypothetical protein
VRVRLSCKIGISPGLGVDGEEFVLMSADRIYQPTSPLAGRTGAIAALSLVVAVVLGDSGVVTLALPEILRDFGAEVGEVAWVLIAFNLVLLWWRCRRPVYVCAGIRPRRPPLV